MATTKKSSATPIMVSMDKDWQAQSDLRTLAEARKIKADQARLKAAKEMAQSQMIEAASAAADVDD